MSNASRGTGGKKTMSKVNFPRFKDAVNELKRDALVLRVLEAKSILFLYLN